MLVGVFLSLDVGICLDWLGAVGGLTSQEDIMVVTWLTLGCCPGCCSETVQFKVCAVQIMFSEVGVYAGVVGSDGLDS